MERQGMVSWRILSMYEEGEETRREEERECVVVVR